MRVTRTTNLLLLAGLATGALAAHCPASAAYGASDSQVRTPPQARTPQRAGHLPAEAPEGGTPLPVLIFPRFVASSLAGAGVKVPMESLLPALTAYLNSYEQALLRLDAEFAVQEPPRKEISARGAASDKLLRDTLFATIAAAASDDDAEVIDALRRHEMVSQAIQRMQGGFGIQRYRAPDDISGWITWGVPKNTIPLAERRHLLMLAAEMAEERAAAFADAGAMRASNEPDSTAPGTKAWDRMTRAQLETYRAIVDKLPDAARKALRLYWVPRMLNAGAPQGMPRFVSGSSDSAIPDLVRELLRHPDLDESGRDQVRAIGRSWIADDDAIIDGAMKQAISTGTFQATSGARNERVKTAIAAMAKVPGLEWLAPADGRIAMPQFEPTTLSEADIKEFGAPLAVGQRIDSAVDSDALAVGQGLPGGYSPAESDRLALQMQLTDDQRLIVELVLADARERWNADVFPLVKAAAPTARPQVLSAGGAAGQEWQRGKRAEAEVRATAWAAASATDDAVFELIAAALGESWDRSALLVARAARKSKRLPADQVHDGFWVPRPSRFVDIPSLLLEAPLSSAARHAGIAAIVPHLPGWLDALSIAVDADQSARLARLDQRVAAGERRDFSTPPPRDDPFALAVRETGKQAAAAHATFQAASDAMNTAVAQALPPADQSRWTDYVAALRRPHAYLDLQPFWRAFDQAAACLPADSRQETVAAIEPVLRALTERNRRIGAHIASFSGELDEDRSQVFFLFQGAALGLATVDVMARLPDQCRAPFLNGVAEKFFGNVREMDARQPAIDR